MSALLIGFRKFKSKAGNDCCIVNLLDDFTAFDVQHGACGQKVDEVFIPESSHSLIIPSRIGSYCDLEYGAGAYGKPAVVGIRFLEDKK